MTSAGAGAIHLASRVEATRRLMSASQARSVATRPAKNATTPTDTIETKNTAQKAAGPGLMAIVRVNYIPLHGRAMTSQE